ncbi:hypothetical protein [Bernardetia sp. MNP-M8]|uniref:hypothetical protein n=1 Tax=Bernardetia sp. MNP-M8 TaxID=3127470 RepID=UPI0030CFCDF5
MKFLDSLLPTKEVVYQTSLSSQKVIQRIESKISARPIRKSIFDAIPLSYYGKVEGNTFELGRRSRGNKDRPPRAQGVIESNSDKTIVRANINANRKLKSGMIFMIVLINISALPLFFAVLDNDSESYELLGLFIFMPIFFSFGFLVNYLILINRNNKFAKYIATLIDGKIIK